jgi:hypothetical protein
MTGRGLRGGAGGPDSRKRRTADARSDPDDSPLFRDVAGILARHDPLGLGRRSLPLESREMAPGAVHTGLEPPEIVVRPPAAAVERLARKQGSELDVAPRVAKRGAHRMMLERPPAGPEQRTVHLGLRREYGRIYNDAISILSRHDPSIAEFGRVTEDEYLAGARALMPRLARAASETAVRRALEEEFSRLYGRDVAVERDAAESETWNLMGSEIWEAVRRERLARR